MSRCILCGKKLNNKIYSLDNMPSIVQNLPTKDMLSSDKGITLDLYECEGCGLVQFDCEPVYYYKDVIRAVGLSQTMKMLRHSQYTLLLDNFRLKGKRILEVGCGAGEFLELWNEYDVEAYGVENNESLVAIGQKKGLNVSKGFLDDKYYTQYGPFDAIVSFNYLEHQPNPTEMVRGMYNNLKYEGVGLITVPSFEYFIENASYYEFMRDHIAYYTEKSLRNLFSLNGFDVLDITRFNGDTTQIIIQKRESIKIPDFDFQKEYIQKTINKYVRDNNIKNIAVWGASHQALTLLATLKTEFAIEFIIDSSPIKEGYYSPVSHLEIKSPNNVDFSKLDLIIIMAPAFSSEIANQIRKKCEFEHIIAIKNDEILEL